MSKNDYFVLFQIRLFKSAEINISATIAIFGESLLDFKNGLYSKGSEPNTFPWKNLTDNQKTGRETSFSRKFPHFDFERKKNEAIFSTPSMTKFYGCKNLFR